MDNPLKSLVEYSSFIAEFVSRPAVRSSTVRVWPDSPFTGVATGEIFFADGFRLRIREELDFDAGLIASYGYEAYIDKERLYWYDDFPHPHDPNLAATFPHHKHVPPDIRRNRIPAPELSFRKPNLPAVIQEMEELVKQKKA